MTGVIRMERISVAVGKRQGIPGQREVLFLFVGFVCDLVAEARAAPWCLVP